MRRRTLLIGGAALVVVVVAGVLVVGRLTAPQQPVAGDGGVAALGGRDAVPAWNPVCGLGADDVGTVVADRAADAAPVSPDLWDLPDGDPSAIRASGDLVEVAQQRGDAVTLTQYTADGVRQGGFDLPGTADAAWTLLPDGSVLAVDPAAPTARVVRYGRDGDTVDAFALPVGDAEGQRITSLTPIAVLDGAAAVAVGREGGEVWAIRESGESVGRIDAAPSDVLGAPSGGVVAGVDDIDAHHQVVTAVDLGSGREMLHAAYSTEQTEGLWDTTPSLAAATSLVAAPTGDGYVVATPSGLDWIDPRGVVLATWVQGTDGLSLTSGVVLAQAGDEYVLLVTKDGAPQVAVFDRDTFAAWLTAPQQLTAGSEPDLLRLGIGIGPVVDAPLAHFDAGTTPAAVVRAEPGWGDLAGADRPDWVLRYTVAGDPSLADPVVQDVRDAAPPWGGGDVALDLPATRPGAYEVSVLLVDAATGRTLSGSCLRYSVGAPGADLDLGGLAAGADWGGAAPLRAVQLAARLGIGSTRVQLDVGALVADPTATPSDGAVDWSALPGASLSPDDDPFADLRQAAATAAASGVDLVVQVGQGGDAERAAVDAATWGDWVAVLVAGIEQHAPGIRYWSAWNEPNSTSGTDAAGYVTRIEAPFARAVHAAIPGAQVLGGDTLGIDPDWWRQAVAAGECALVDAVAVHPYTGWNRAWEEDGQAAPGAGFDLLRAALGDACAALPLWDTESGWLADGSEASWAQGRDVARKLLWYGADGVAGWTYFFSEGGFGEAGLSWSLIQYDSHVKPGALAFATVSRLLAGRGTPVALDTGIPYTWAMRIPGDDTLVAVWTDGARLAAQVRTDAAAVAVTDQYGATSTLTPEGGLAPITLTASPQFLRVPAGGALDLVPVESWGPDVLVGAAVTASSTGDDNAAEAATITSGTNDPYLPWRSGPLKGQGLDESPSVTVTLDAPTLLDRIGVVSATMSCCQSSLRHYTVEVRTTDGQWQTVAEPTDQFVDRTAVFAFAPTVVAAVRVSVPWTTVRGVRVLDVNLTPYAGGLPPPGMGLESKTDGAMGIAAISAWAPGAG